MNFDTIAAHVQAHAAAYAVGGVIFLIVAIVLRKFVLPLLYHTGEYLLYFAVAHSFIAGFVRVFSWFREETEFKNFKGELPPTWTPYTTPMNLNFWQKALYNPHWLFWVELAIAAGLLYVVVMIRPTRLRHKTYKSKRPAPGAISGSKPYAGLARKDGGKMKPIRSR
jgi:hypothetical protein